MLVALAMAGAALVATSCGDDDDDNGSVHTPAGPVAVDLGLPSGTKWANMNVGSTSPEGYGLYFAWGETKGYTIGEQHDFSWENYKWCNGSWDTQTKYCTDSELGKVDNKTTLELADDAAHVNWGGGWRMPTLADIKELLDNTTHTWTTVGGVKGTMFKSKVNGNSIFLPAAGGRAGSSLSDEGTGGYFWSSSLYAGYSYGACGLYFYSGNADWCSIRRNNGQTVRAVFRN